MDESGTEREGQQQNERDRGQSAVGDRLAFAVFGMRLGAMPAGMEKALLESPVLSEIVPPMVLLFPTVVAEPPHQRGGKACAAQVVIQSHSCSVVSACSLPAR